MTLIARWRRGKRSKTATQALLPNYRQPGWLSRHRKLVLAVTFAAIFFYSVLFLLIGRFLIVPFATPLVILGALIIWALPERERIPDQLLQRLFIAFMVAALIWPNYLALSVSNLPWITAARLIGVPMVLILMICLSQSARFGRDLREPLLVNPVITKMMLAYTVLIVLSVGFSTDVGHSSNSLIIALVNWVAIFFVAVFVFSRPGNVERFVWLLWFVTLFWCVMGFWEWRNSQVPWANSIPSFLKIEDEVVQRILDGSARSATKIYRVQGKYTTPLGLAEYMAMATPFILHFAMAGRTHLIKLAAAISLPVVCWVIIVTDSRLGVVGFLLSFLFYLFFWGVQRWRQDQQSLFGPAVTLAYPLLFVGFIVATFTVRRLRSMVWGSGAQAASDQSRQVQVEMGLQDIVERPWGYGIGQAADALGFSSPSGILTIDNYYLSIALEIGIIGFIVYYGMFLVAIVRGGVMAFDQREPEQLWIIPAVISLTNFVIIKSVLSQQEGHSLAFALLGMVVALLARPVIAARSGGPNNFPSAR